MTESASANQQQGEDEGVRRVVIPYMPRKHFLPLHNSLKRFVHIVAHRRAGKTVALCNKIIRAGLENKRKFPPPRYGYIGPSFAQTKDLVWGYFKHYTGVLPNVKVTEGELQLTLSNGALVNLYGGASAYERMRGIYFDGAVLDEFPLLNPAAWSTIVRPCLADYRGWAVISGTSNGDDHFHALRKKHLNDPDWDIFTIPVNETDALNEDEVVDMTKDMSPEEYAREMMCSFDAPVEGAFYAHILNEIQAAGHITGVPHDSTAQVFTWWDLGIDDETVVWFVEYAGRELHVIDYHSGNNMSLEDHAKIVSNKPYQYAAHVLPHDVKVRELGTGKSRFEILHSLLNQIVVCPFHRVEDGISATRNVLRMCWFDAAKCEHGISALRNYHKTNTGQPLHNWASHPADAFRVGSVALNIARMFISNRSNVVPLRRPIRRHIRGLAHG